MFNNRAEQISHYMTRFVKYLNEVSPTPNPLLESLSSAPVTILVGKAAEIVEAHKDAIEKEDMKVVYQLVVEYSNSSTIKGLTDDANTFIEELERDQEKKRKFFAYLKLLKKLIG